MNLLCTAIRINRPSAGRWSHFYLGPRLYGAGGFWKKGRNQPFFYILQTLDRSFSGRDGGSRPEAGEEISPLFGPSTAGGFGEWLGCSPAQAGRIWNTVADEIEPVSLAGKERFILTEDRELLFSPPEPERELHLLGGHDPYLGLQDRQVILEDRTRQKQIWQTVSNPGAVLWHGEITGMWKARKKGKGLDVEVTLWDGMDGQKKGIENLVEEYVLFQKMKLNQITFLT